MDPQFADAVLDGSRVTQVSHGHAADAAGDDRDGGLIHETAKPGRELGALPDFPDHVRLRRPARREGPVRQGGDLGVADEGVEGLDDALLDLLAAALEGAGYGGGVHGAAGGL